MSQDVTDGGAGLDETAYGLPEEAAKRGISVPTAPRFNIYTAMLLVGFFALSIACGLMYLELRQYDFEFKPPAYITK